MSWSCRSCQAETWYCFQLPFSTWGKNFSEIHFMFQSSGKMHQHVHSVGQKSIGLKFSKSRTGSDVRYSCHHNLSPPLALLLCETDIPLYLLQLAASLAARSLALLAYTSHASVSSPFMPTTSSDSRPVCYRSVLRTCIPVFYSSQPRKMCFTYFFRCVLKLFPIIV